MASVKDTLLITCGDQKRETVTNKPFPKTAGGSMSR